MKKRILAFILGAGLLVSGIFCAPVFAASQPALLKTVLKYDVNPSTNKWRKVEKQTYKYKKGYPTAVSIYSYAAEETYNKTFKYTFKNGVPTEMERTDIANNTLTKFTYNKNGTVERTYTTRPKVKGFETSVYIYGKTNYFTSVFHDAVIENPSGMAYKFNFREEEDSVSVSVKNGLLKKTVNRGIYANWDNPETKEWHRFEGTYTAAYDKNGIASLTAAQFRTWPNSGYQNKFKITRKDGLITQVVKYRWNADAGKWEYAEKFVFQYYPTTEISKARYANMINAQIMGEQNQYYIYNWY